MKLVISLAILLLCLLVSIPAHAQAAEVDWTPGTDFSRFHTYTWATAAYPIQDPDASLGMALAVDEELAAKGVRFVSPQQKFDVFVTYNAQINPDVQDSSRKGITIKVRIFDSSNNTVIWRAGGYVELGNDRLQNRRNVRAMLAAMFQQYPPSR